MSDVLSARKKRFYRVRVAILLFILFVVVLYAVRDLRSRHERNDWQRTLDVAVVLVHVDGVGPLESDAVRLLNERVPALEERLSTEARRHRPTALPPFRVRLFGPVDVGSAPPTPASDGLVDLAKHTAALRQWLQDVDPRAGVVPDHWDTRIYVDLRPASKAFNQVEGQSQSGGRIGTVTVELDRTMADLTLFVVAHELMHTLGATDKYDPSGRVRIPDGLVEPSRSPLYPQPFAEVMARNRCESASKEVVPATLDELGVGAVTAREIGWLRP